MPTSYNSRTIPATTYTARTIPATTYTARTIPATTYTARTPINRLGSYICDRLGNRICDRLGNPFILYDANGSIDIGGTIYTSRNLI